MSEPPVALVTGASGGIGGACARVLATDGYAVAVHYHSNEAGAQATVDAITAAGGEAWLTPFDAADPQAVDKAIRAIIKERKRLDALVVAAGVVFNQMLALTGVDDLDKLWAINLRGAYLAAKAASKQMIRQRSGRIVFLGSIVGERGNAGQSAYAMTKAGLVGLGKSLARELAPRNITVNIVAPGYVETAMTKDLTSAQQSAILQQVPLGRAGTPEQIAALVAFVCSDAADYITGAVLPVDGGLGT